MKINLEERRQKHQKTQKISLILAIVFFVLTIASLLCFVLFSNYKIQLLMSIIGSVVTSLLLMAAIGFFIAGYLYNKHLVNFYIQLESKEEQSLKGHIKNLEKHMTLKKGLSFLVVYINNNEYYLADEEMINSFDEEKDYSVSLRGNYVVGVE